MRSGDFDTAADLLAAMTQLSDRLQLPALLWHTALNQATEALRLGDSERGQKLADVALELGTESGQPDAFTTHAGQMAFVSAQQGRFGELVPLFEQFVAENPGQRELAQGLAFAYVDQGDDERAAKLLDEGAADGFASLPVDSVWLFGITAYADLAAHLRAEGPARQLYALLSPYHDQYAFISSTAQHCPVATYLGGLADVLGRYDEAEAYFAEAADFNARGSMTYSAARTDFAWARMLRSRQAPGDRQHAVLLLERARSAAQTMGYGSVARQVADELAHWGVDED